MAPRSKLPAIATLARRVLAGAHEAVLRFPRVHRYGVGIQLCNEAMEVSRRVLQAWHDKEHQLDRVDDLSDSIDSLKITVQLGKDLNAFASFGQFEALVRLIGNLGRQCGGWRNRLRSQGQNDQTRASDQRAQILSSPAAPEGANL